MSRFTEQAVLLWSRVGTRFMPFADTATAELPMARLMRLALFQVTVGVATVLLVGTLNRVMIVELGEIRDPVHGKTLHVAPDYDHDVETDIAEWFEKYYSIRFRNYPVTDDYLQEQETVPCE